MSWNITPCKTAVQQIDKFLLYLCKKLRMLVPVIKGYRAAFNHDFSLAVRDLAANRIINRMFSSFEKNLSLVLKSLAAKRVSELHGISY